MAIAKALNQELIRMANNCSMGGERGNSSEASYYAYVKQIQDMPISDEKKQQLLDTLYKKWSKVLTYESQHVSVMVAGPSKYNAKRLDKSDKILQTYSEIDDWFKGIERQISQSRCASKVEIIKINIIGGLEYGYNISDDWKKLAVLDKEEYKKLYEKLNAKHNFRKNTTAYKLYHDLDSIEEKKKEMICENNDYIAYTEGDRAYIRFTLKPKQQLIIALKRRGWWWNGMERAWSTYLNRLDKAWVLTIRDVYSQYL